MEEKLKGIIELVEDSINTDYPDLAVEAMFNPDKRLELRKRILSDHKKILSEDTVDTILAEIVGLGYFEDLIRDEEITDIGWNGTDLWVETSQYKEKIVDVKMDERYIRRIIQRFANYAHQDFSEKNPILDTQLGNIRINAVHNVISTVGTTMSMRHARNRLVLTKENWHTFAKMSVYELFEDLFKVGINVVITGEVGTGKTELQKLLIGFVPDKEKLIMIEDTLETHLKDIYPEKDIISWLVPPGFSHTQMIKASLRNNPKYVVLSEARDAAIYEIHQSVLTGHKIILTAHAVDARAFIPRMIGMTKQEYDVDERTLEMELLKYYNIGVHIEKRLIDGKMHRYIDEVVEYTENGLLTLYKQVIIEGEDTIEIEESFGLLSQEMVDLLKNHNIHSKWNNQIPKKGG